MSLVKSTAIIASMTLLSRISGFVRDVLVANIIGASWLSDAFFVAFKLPNFFRRLFAEGAFNAAFVPQFSRNLSEGREQAIRFASEALSVLLVALLLLNGVFLVFMPVLLQLFAPGFADEPEKYDLAVSLARICFPYILFVSVVSLIGGMLNSLGKFAAVAVAPVLLNLSLIAAILILPPYTSTAAHALSFGVFVAGIVQLLWLLGAAHRADALPSLLVPRLTARVRTLFRVMAPAALGAGVAQVNLLVDVVLASTMPEAVSYLYYADRINELPIGVIGVAVGTALLPMLSRQLREGQLDAARHGMNRAIELVLLFGLPAATAMLLIPQPIIQTLYEHGQFTAGDTLATYSAMMAYAAGLPAFVLIKVLAPGFFANQDTKTPFIIASICVVVNLCLNLLLMQYYAHVGLAAATSIAGWLNAGLMALVLYRRSIWRPDAALLLHLPRMLLACAVMGVVLVGLYQLLGDTPAHLWGRVLALAALVVAGMLSYGVCVVAFKAVDRQQIRASLRRKQQR